MQYTQHLTIDVFKQEQFQYIHAVQFDHCARQLVITPTADGEPLTIPDTATAVFRCLKHDGTSVVNPATVDAAAGTVTFELTDQALACEGMARADVSIIDGKNVISTLTFFIMVEKAPTSDSQIESSNEFLYIVQVAAEVEAYAKRAEEAADSTEEVAKGVEDVSAEVEAAKAYAESASGSANAAKSSAEQAGDEADAAANSAKTAQTAQVAAENAQMAAEAARDAAQGIAGGDFATRAELSSHEGNQTLHITADERTAWNSKSDFNGDYTSLKNQPDIPTKVSELENDKNYITSDEVPEALPTVTTDDNDKVLMVVDGEWAAAEIINAEGVAY